MAHNGLGSSHQNGDFERIVIMWARAARGSKWKTEDTQLCMRYHPKY